MSTNTQVKAPITFGAVKHFLKKKGYAKDSNSHVIDGSIADWSWTKETSKNIWVLCGDELCTDHWMFELHVYGHLLGFKPEMSMRICFYFQSIEALLNDLDRVEQKAIEIFS